MGSAADAEGSSLAARAAAWSVHVLTASGAGMGLLALLEAARGDSRASALWLLAAFAVDCVDGTLARAARVRERTPSIDGRRLDDVIDFLNYVIVPCFFLAQGGFVAWGWAVLPALASAYQFAQADAKTADHFFLGFPSYWNIVSFYLYALHPQPWVSATLITVCAVLTFVPTPYIYATRGGPFATLVNTGAAVWFLLLGLVLYGPENQRGAVALVSLVYPLMYLGLSALITRGRHANRPLHERNT